MSSDTCRANADCCNGWQCDMGAQFCIPGNGGSTGGTTGTGGTSGTSGDCAAYGASCLSGLCCDGLACDGASQLCLVAFGQPCNQPNGECASGFVCLSSGVCGAQCATAGQSCAGGGDTCCAGLSCQMSSGGGVFCSACMAEGARCSDDTAPCCEGLTWSEHRPGLQRLRGVSGAGVLRPGVGSLRQLDGEVLRRSVVHRNRRRNLPMRISFVLCLDG